MLLVSESTRRPCPSSASAGNRRPVPLTPEPRAEPVRQLRRPRPQVRPRPARRARRAGPRPDRGLVGVPLHLAQRDRDPRRSGRRRTGPSPPESFQPWLDSPCPVGSRYSRKPSPSASPYSVIQLSAPRSAGSSSRTVASSSPARQASCSRQTNSGGGVDRAVVARRQADVRRTRSVPRRSSWMILPGCSADSGSTFVALQPGQGPQRPDGAMPDRRPASAGPTRSESRPNRVKYQGAPAA